MKNFIQDGKTLNYTNTGSAILSGDVVVVGKVVGIAQGDIAATTGTGIIAVKGVYQVPKTTSLVITQGDKLFWNTGTGKVTKTATDAPMGIAWESELSAATTVKVKLGSSDEAGQAADVAALAGTLTGTTTGTMLDVAATAAATAGGSTPTAAQVDTGIATAVATIVTGVNKQNKEVQTTVNAILAALKAAGLMA